MNKLLTPVLVFVLAAGAAAENIAGKWQLSLNTPHGLMSGALEIKQDGDRLSGSCTTEHTGTIPLTGSMDGKKVSFTLELPDFTLKMSGAVEGDKMTGTANFENTTWSATRQTAGAAARMVLGAIAGIEPAKLEFIVKPDRGAPERFHAGAETQVVQVPPGERDLEHGAPVRLTDIAIGDRVLVSFTEGMADARRIVLISADEIAKRNEAEKLDWQGRGITGIVASTGASEIVLSGPAKTVIVVTGHTKVRQYAPGSVSFAAALPSTVAAIAPGDQIRARGDRTADGARLTADELVFGTFLTKVGTVIAIDSGRRQVRLQDLTTKTPLTVNLSSESQIKLVTEARPEAGAHEAAGATDIAHALQRMPAGKLEDLKVGGAVVVTATRSSRPDEVTAIMLLTNIEGFLQMAQAQASRQGIGLMEAMSAMHGGAMAGPAGFSLPVILP